jgi:hypothetical protein
MEKIYEITHLDYFINEEVTLVEAINMGKFIQKLCENDKIS